jgi:hypothetical protein
MMQTTLKPESVLRSEAMKLLIEHFGVLDAQRFVSSVNADRLNYTDWRQDKWDGKTVEELHNEAATLYHARYPQE